MRAKAERLSRAAEHWERGAEGERRTAELLAQLPATEWTVFHDVRWPGRRYANVDHVVVGPPGVFVIDSKNWSGSIVVRDQVLRQNGRSRETTVAGAAQAALAVSGMTQIVGPYDVHPVLCFVRDEPLAGWARDVMVCSTANLLDLLQSRPHRLDAPARQQLCLDLDASLRGASQTSGTAPPQSWPPQSRPARRNFAPPPRAPRTRSTAKKRSKAGSGSLAGLVGCLVVAVLGYSVYSGISESASSEKATDAPGVAVAPSPRLAPLLGTWSGEYICSDKSTSATLRVTRGTSADEVRAVLGFRLLEDDVRGKFALVGTLDSGQVGLSPTEWIDRPTGFSFIGLRGQAPRKGAARWNGEVSPGIGCTTFAFERVE